MGLNDPSKKASILRVVDVIVVRWRPDRMCDPFCEGQGSGDCSSCSGLRRRTCKTGNHTWCSRSTSRQGSGRRIARAHNDDSAHCGQCHQVPSYTLTLIKVRPDDDVRSVALSTR